jgi:transcriptional regulator with XRE-family HTH domain
MKMIKEIREFYGFSQAILAQYLGISRGRLAMAETGKRDLPTDHYLKLSKLASAIHPRDNPLPGPGSKTGADHQKNKWRDFAKEKLAEQKYKMRTCQRALGGMKRKHDQALRALDILAVLKAKPEGLDSHQYEVMEITSAQLLEKTSVAKFHLEMHMEGLRAKSDFLQAAIREDN